MAAELPRPGVEVIQVFRTVSPTVITPTLVPCVVGVCRQVVEVLQPNAAGSPTLNNDALVPLQANFVAKPATGTPPKYTGLDTLALVFSANGGPDITVTFAGVSLSPAQVVAQVRNALVAAGNTTVVAETVNTDSWRLRSLAADDDQVIDIRATTAATVGTAFGIGLGRTYAGASFYAQREVFLPTAAFPDPRRNLAQLSFDTSTIRAFIYMGGSGGSLVEVKRDRSFLRYAVSTPAARVGTIDLTTLVYPTDAGTKTLVLSINGGTALTVTFASPANIAALLAQINAVISLVATASLAPSTNFLVISSLATGATASVQVVSGTALGVLGLTATTVTGIAAVQAVDDGNGDAITPLLRFPGQNILAAGTAAAMTGTTVITAGVADGLTLIVGDGTSVQTVTFLTAGSSTLVLAQINKVLNPAAGGHITATVDGGTHLVLTSNRLGLESKVNIIGGTALTALGLSISIIYGGAFPAKVGDELYIDGAFFAMITQVGPGATTDRVKINKSVAISTSVGNAFYIVARNLPDATPASRPAPDLVVGLDGSLTLKLDLLRDNTGAPLSTASRAQLALAYKAIRKDVTASAPRAALLRFNDTVALSSQLSPINADNPLALGLYFALLNAPGTQVTGLGVDASSGSSPDGTVEAFTRAASFLEAYEVYAIAPMTNDASVGQVFATHASVMSTPSHKGERIALYAPAQPLAKVNVLVASGLAGNSAGTLNVFDTAVVNLGALLLAQGLSPVGSFLVSDGVFLDVGDGFRYSVTSISGGLVTIKMAFAAGENDDGFYATTNLSGALIGQAFAVRIRGAALTLLDGTVDKEALALTYQKMAAAYSNRRFWHVIAPQVAATLGGLEQVLKGYYACAAAAGMVGRQPPQQSFTNFPMTGFTRVIGTNGFLTERQLDVVAAGGNYVIVQDEDSSPLISRMALTTDMTSIETRTDSITKVVDFCAKFLRRGLKNFIGRFNITQGFLDSLGHVIQGLLGFLSESGVLIGSHLNNIIQDENSPDTVLFDITLDVPFPCNYMRLTLVV